MIKINQGAFNAIQSIIIYNDYIAIVWKVDAEGNLLKDGKTEIEKTPISGNMIIGEEEKE